jgi:hypothetical protein
MGKNQLLAVVISDDDEGYDDEGLQVHTYTCPGNHHRSWTSLLNHQVLSQRLPTCKGTSSLNTTSAVARGHPGSLCLAQDSLCALHLLSMGQTTRLTRR